MYHTLLNYSLKKVICYTAHCIIFWYIVTCPKIYCHIFNSINLRLASHTLTQMNMLMTHL